MNDYDISNILICPICNKYRLDGILHLRKPFIITKGRKKTSFWKSCFSCIRDYKIPVGNYWFKLIFWKKYLALKKAESVM